MVMVLMMTTQLTHLIDCSLMMMMDGDRAVTWTDDLLFAIEFEYSELIHCSGST